MADAKKGSWQIVAVWFLDTQTLKSSAGTLSQPVKPSSSLSIERKGDSLVIERMTTADPAWLQRLTVPLASVVLEERWNDG